MNEKLAGFIDKLPLLPTIAIGVWMTLAPFTPEPHLVEKFFMAMSGNAFKLIDVFDVFMHAGFGVIAVLKGWRELSKRNNGADEQDA